MGGPSTWFEGAIYIGFMEPPDFVVPILPKPIVQAEEELCPSGPPPGFAAVSET